jgi:hypothetical protein
MKNTLALFLVGLMTILFGTVSQAGFQGYQSTTNLGLFQAVKCSTGLTCSKVGEKLNIVATTSGVLETTATATSISLDSTYCGQTLKNAAYTQVGLPNATSALVGCRITFATANATSFYVNPGDTDAILIQTNASGDRILNATLGNTITIQAIAVSLWAPIGVVGTWSDAN